MDLFNRPPTISEDTVQYAIHPPQDLSDKASVTAFAAYIQAFAETLLPDFIWHRDAFEVKVVAAPEGTDKWMLEGRMRVGDCVDDEWCTVWLLREISSKRDVVVSVFDSDGEFLLIEAAEALPSWVQPSNSENRVWIYNSRLHLIPLSHISPPSRRRHRRKLPGSTGSDDEFEENEEGEEFLEAEDGVKLCRDPVIDTLAPPEVEKLVWDRISGYPAALKSHIHTTKAYVPIDVAKALVGNPHLVQKVVETFYTRDAIQLRAAHRMSRFPPDISVLRPVSMTRTAYAQLVGQKFFPPKIFGRWQERDGTKERRWRDVGMKLAVGFEMLYQESKGRLNNSNISTEGIESSAEAVKDSLRRNPDYQKYIQHLKSANYFQGQVEGSELWKTLENKAATTFVEARRSDDATRPSFATQVDVSLSKVGSLPDMCDQDEDEDSWLNIDAKDFEALLERNHGASNPRKGVVDDSMDIDKTTAEQTTDDHIASAQADRLKALASKVKDFVEGEGDLEGARFEDEEFSDGEFSDDDSSQSSDHDELMEQVDSDRRAAMDKLVPPLEQSDYGKMPASYHANSQRVKPTTLVSEVIEEDQSIGENKPSKIPETGSLPKAKPVRQPILPRDKYDGVDSDDETDEESEEDEEDEEDRPQVVGEIEVDMQEEEEEFLEFSRQALGISDQHWNEIIKDRKGRGAFLPASAIAKPELSASKDKPVSETKPSDKGKAKANSEPRVPLPGPRPNVNPELDSFEAVMKALDEELARIRSEKASSQPSNHAAGQKGKEKAVEEEAEGDEDIEAAMEAELKAALGQAEDDDENMNEGEEPVDYNLIKNFLESFKSQAGLSGPVSNLAGRLQPGWKLSRDDS